MNKITLNIMEHASGSIGGVLGVMFGYVTGTITFSGTFQTAFYALIGGVVGYFTVKLIKFIEKKCKRNGNQTH